MVAGSGTMTSAPPPAVGGNGTCANVNGNTSNVPGNINVPAAPQGTNEAGSTRTKASENRRSNKPIMEKRRRARINNCLNELKTLILDAMKKDPARHSKLEKADILEMTVKHLEALQRQQVAMAAATDPNVANKFRAGFTECAGEVGRFPGLDGPIKRRLLQHLANCLNSTNPPNTPTTSVTNSVTDPVTTPTNSPLQVHILRTPVQKETPVVQQTNTSNIILANTNGQGVQLVPTRLPNGDIALILPSSNSFRTARVPTSTTPSASPSPSASSNSSSSSPLPMLVPIPNKTTSNNSPPPVAIDRLSVSSTAPQQITILTTQNSPRILIPQTPKDKSVPLLATTPYQYPEENEKTENVIQQRVIIPESFIKPEKVMKTFDEVPVIHDMQSTYLKIRKEEVIEHPNNYNGNGGRPVIDDSLYERNRIIMTHDVQIIENEHSPRYVSDKMYSPERETLLHIPERDYYDSGSQSYSPRSPVGYIESMDSHAYGGYYSSHFDRSYSPDIQKPLALVTKKKYEEYENEEKPWRPW